MSGHPEALQHLRNSDGLPWHQHDAAYVAIVLEGGYSEAGDDGRRTVRAGDVVIHQPFCGHVNRFECRGALIVNFALTRTEADGLASGRCADPERLAVEMRGGGGPRLASLRDSIVVTPDADDLPDLLATALRADSVRLDQWANEHGVAERTLRRQFALAYGMSAAAYRARARARRAWSMIAGSDQALADLSYSLGFADQAHLSRAVRQLSTMSPTAVRALGRLVQD